MEKVKGSEYFLNMLLVYCYNKLYDSTNTVKETMQRPRKYMANLAARDLATGCAGFCSSPALTADIVLIIWIRHYSIMACFGVRWMSKSTAHFHRCSL